MNLFYAAIIWPIGPAIALAAYNSLASTGPISQKYPGRLFLGVAVVTWLLLASPCAGCALAFRGLE